MTSAGLRTKLGWLLPVLLSGCASAIPQSAGRPTSGGASPAARPAPPPVFRPPPLQQGAGLESVLQQNAASLVRQFGNPQLDVREGDTRKLQFAGQACVLDVFLYPLSPGSEPVATFVEARRASDGADVDKPSCVAALQRR